MAKTIKIPNTKIFLGGDCNSNWRKEKFIPYIYNDYFNPVVDDWTPDCIKTENVEKDESKYLLFVFNKYCKGVYSVAEASSALFTLPKDKKLLILLDTEGMDESQKRSYCASVNLIQENYNNNKNKIKCILEVFNKFDDLISFLNKEYIEKAIEKVKKFLQNNVIRGYSFQMYNEREKYLNEINNIVYDYLEKVIFKENFMHINEWCYFPEKQSLSKYENKIFLPITFNYKKYDLVFSYSKFAYEIKCYNKNLKDIEAISTTIHLLV